MNKYYYDLHVHSCLSPCADDDNTPYNLAGMAALLNINIMALTDHNTCKNCPAFFGAAKQYGIIPIAGMELTTSEDIHVICLFERLEDALAFDKEIDSRRIKIDNRPDIFGRQLILGKDDELVGEEPYLLSNATTVALDEAPDLANRFGGICYPAHIDREANGIIAVLGDMPPTPRFTCAEFHFGDKKEEYSGRFCLPQTTVVCSDAHYLTDLRDAENYFLLPDEPYSGDLVRGELFKLLRG